MKRFLSAPNIPPNVCLLVAIVSLSAIAFARLSVSMLTPLNEDVVMVTHAARTLAETGSLKDVGYSMPFQVLRPGPGFGQPYWFQYTGPVFFFSVFFRIFGASDAIFFLAQGVALASAAFCLRRLLSWGEILALLSACILSESITGSILRSPTQLLAIVAILFLWERWQKPETPRGAAVAGLVAGFGAHMRPEVIAVFLLYISFVRAERGPKLKKSRLLAMSGGAFAAAYAACSGLRFALGGGASSDHSFYLVATNVAAQGWGTMGLKEAPSFLSFLTDSQNAIGLLGKVSAGLASTLHGGGTLGARPDVWLLPVLLIGLWLEVFSWRRYISWFLLVGVQAVVNAGVLDVLRYYDYVFVLLWIMLWHDVRPFVVPRLHRPSVALVSALVLTLVAGTALSEWPSESRRALRSRAEALAKSEEAHRLVPRDAHVVTDDAPLWLWYGNGRYACFAPTDSPETVRLVLQRFPETYWIFFRGLARVRSSIEPLKTLPTLRTTAPLIIHAAAERVPLDRGQS